MRRDFFATNGFGGWGGRLDVERTFGARGLASVDLELASGQETVALGDAGALLVSLGGFWGMKAASGLVAGSLAVGARVGMAHLSGTPAGGSGATGASALRPWWGPAIAARGAIGPRRDRLRAFAGDGPRRPRRRGSVRKHHRARRERCLVDGRGRFAFLIVEP